MLIVNDLGTDAVNSDAAFVYACGNAPDGTTVLLAYGPGVNTVLASVGDRPQRALEAIIKATKEGWKILNLHDSLGERPNIAIAKPSIIRPGNGEGRPS